MAEQEATTTLAKAHNSAPTTNASHGSPMGGVGRGIGPVLPMFRATRARQTNGVPTRTHQKPTESFSRDSLPLLAHPTCPGPRVAVHAAQDHGRANFLERRKAETQLPGIFLVGNWAKKGV